MQSDLFYDGQVMKWHGKGLFKATTGYRNYQSPEYQCIPDRGPVPAGNYYVPLINGAMAKDDGKGNCRLKPSWQLQTIPRGTDAGECEPMWANWGRHRIRLVPADARTKNVCSPFRDGFYLHDSTKGFSHGCIEIEANFFLMLSTYMRGKHKDKLYLTINYVEGRSTYGNTKVP